jgi:hypothetical protein
MIRCADQATATSGELPHVSRSKRHSLAREVPSSASCAARASADTNSSAWSCRGREPAAPEQPTALDPAALAERAVAAVSACRSTWTVWNRTTARVLTRISRFTVYRTVLDHQAHRTSWSSLGYCFGTGGHPSKYGSLHRTRGDSAVTVATKYSIDTYRLVRYSQQSAKLSRHAVDPAQDRQWLGGGFE